MMKRFILILLSICLLLVLIPVGAMASEPSALFAGGSGTQEDPYRIDSAQALDGVRQYPKAHYLQIRDIDLSGWGSWEPITNFRGSYDGGGYTIANLSISAIPGREDGMNFGLFGFGLDGASFRNINLTNASIVVDGTYVDFYGLMLQGYDEPVRVGGICAETGHFENCSVDGSIRVLECAAVCVGGIVGDGAYDLLRCTNSASIYASSTKMSDMYGFSPAYCGGITGWNYMSDSIEGCSNSGSVQLDARGEGHLGGIVGMQKGPVEDCANFGYILCTGSGYAGGIAGSVQSGLSRCVNYGNVSGDVLWDAEQLYVGGIAGTVNAYSASGSIRNCYNLGRELVAQETFEGRTTAQHCGRICGSIEAESALSGCGSFYDTRLNGLLCENPSGAQGVNLTAEDLLRQETYEGFDFTNLWSISFEHGGAVLNIASPTPPDAPITEIVPFCELTYRADYLTSGKMNILTDPALYNSLISCAASPCRIIVEAHGEGMHTAASAWNAIVKSLDTFTGNPEYAITHNLQQHDLLVAYILDAVGTQMEFTVVDSYKDITKEVSDLASVLSDAVSTFDEKKELFSDYCSENMEKLMDKIGSFYDSHNGFVSGLMKTADGLQIIAACAREASNVTQLADNIVGFVNLYHASDSTKQVLRTMYRLCPKENENLKAALGTVCEIMNAATDKLFGEMLSGKLVMSLTVNSGIFVTKKLFEFAANELAAAFPLAGAALAICKTQAYAVDKLFGVDKSVEQYFKMCALMELDQLTGLTINQTIIDYKDEPTAENAQILLSAIDLKRSLIDLDFNEALKYADIIHDEGIVRKVMNLLGDGSNDLKKSILSLRATEDAMFHSLQTAWLIPLAVDYPDIAKIYDQRLAEDFWEYLVTFHCPVEIELYDAKGNREAIILEGIITTFSPISAVYYDGSKTLLLPSGDWRILCRGYDQGEMDVEVTVRDKNTDSSRTLYYYNLPVSVNSTYTLTTQASDPRLTDPTGNFLIPSYDSFDDSLPKYELSVENGLILGEIMASTGQINPGQPIEIYALVPQGRRFTGWRTKTGDALLSDPQAPSTTLIMPHNDVALMASFNDTEINHEDVHKDGPDPGFRIPWLGITAAAAVLIVLWLLLGKRKNQKR